jgi:hypothetical protein
VNRTSDSNRGERVANDGEATLGLLMASQLYGSREYRGFTTTAEAGMVESTSRKPVMVFKVLDRYGQPIGEIVQPKVAPVVGRGARTVLLVRGEQRGADIR